MKKFIIALSLIHSYSLTAMNPAFEWESFSNIFDLDFTNLEASYERAIDYYSWAGASKNLITIYRKALRNIDIYNYDIDLPILSACKYGHTGIVRLLILAGANIDARDSEYGNTPLILATINNHAFIVQILINAGANLEMTNNWGEKALNYAQLPHIKNILQENGAVHNNFFNLYCR